MMPPRLIGQSLRRGLPLALTLLAGCAVGPRYVRPDAAPEVPAQWAQEAATRETAAEDGRAVLPATGEVIGAQTGAQWRWWEDFGDTTLNRLVADALAHNNDLAAAAARVLEARALAGGASAAQWPTVEIGGSAVRSKSSEQLLAGPFSPYGNLFDASATGRYEIDLWRRLGSGKEAALAALLASEQDRRAVAQTLIAEVVRTWLVVRELELQVDLSQRTVTSFQHSLATVTERYERGLVSALDLNLSRQNLAAAQANEPVFRQQLAEARRRLEVLAGQYPAGRAPDHAAGIAADLTTVALPSTVPAGLPSGLLERRPDLQAAELRLRASVARIGEAKAALYPRFSLTATAGTKSREWDDLFTGPTNVWSLAGNLFMPLLNRGATKAQIKAAEARTGQAAAAYRKAVLTAFAEVENALDQDINLAHQEEFLTRSAAQARRSVDLAADRYRRGLDNLLVTLETQRRLFAAESQLLTVQRSRRAARVQLIQALGGPWEAAAAAHPDANPNHTPGEGAQP